MSTVSRRMSIGAIELLAQGVDGVRQEAKQVRGLWQEFGWRGRDEPRPQSESSIERECRLRRPVDDEWGRSESLDPDNVGDIADEGAGHRG
jgi:hypothetical protein